MDKESFLNPSTDGNKIMWLGLKEKNTSGRFYYNYNDISYYDIKSEKGGNLNLPFDNRIAQFVFNADNVYISMEKAKNGSTLQDRLIKYNTSNKSIKDILPSDDEKAATLRIYNGYVSWDNKNAYNYRMYDFKNNKLIELIDKESINKYSHICYGIVDNILIIRYDKDGKQLIEYYDLDKRIS